MGSCIVRLRLQGLRSLDSSQNTWVDQEQRAIQMSLLVCGRSVSVPLSFVLPTCLLWKEEIRSTAGSVNSIPHCGEVGASRRVETVEPGKDRHLASGRVHVWGVASALLFQEEPGKIKVGGKVNRLT